MRGQRLEGGGADQRGHPLADEPRGARLVQVRNDFGRALASKAELLEPKPVRRGVARVQQVVREAIGGRGNHVRGELPFAGEREDRGALFLGHPRRDGDKSGALDAKEARCSSRGVGRIRADPAVRTPHKAAGDPICNVQRGERKTTGVAHPPGVDVGVVARANTLDLAGAQHFHGGRAAAAALATGGRGFLEVPNPRLEAEGLKGQRADRAHVREIALVVARQRAVHERLDDRTRSEAANGELGCFRNLFHEAHAAAAQHAALFVEDDDVTQALALVEAPARFVRPPLTLSFRERVVLKVTLTGLVADRAVERMVFQEELEALAAHLARGG